MVSRLRASLAYRLPRLYQMILDRLSPAPQAPAETTGLTLLFFCGKEQRPLLRESLLSLARSWERLPRVTVVSDGTIDPADLRLFLTWWPGPLEALDWRNFLPEGGDPGSRALARFAEGEVMGRKLIAIVANARRGPVLYSDTDILWFRHPRWLDQLATSPEGPVIRVSVDAECSYDDRLVPDRLPHLAEPPFLCAGLLYACGELLADTDLEPLLEFAAHQGVGRTEQTIIAEISHRLDGVPIPEDEVVTRLDDAARIRPLRRERLPAARHYVQTVRHLFWRDALFSRFALNHLAPRGARRATTR